MTSLVVVLLIVTMLVGIVYFLTVANRRAGAAIARELAWRKQQEARDEANVIARDIARRDDAAERLQNEFSRPD